MMFLISAQPGVGPSDTRRWDRCDIEGGFEYEEVDPLAQWVVVDDQTSSYFYMGGRTGRSPYFHTKIPRRGGS